LSASTQPIPLRVSAPPFAAFKGIRGHRNASADDNWDAPRACLLNRSNIKPVRRQAKPAIPSLGQYITAKEGSGGRRTGVTHHDVDTAYVVIDCGKSAAAKREAR